MPNTFCGMLLSPSEFTDELRLHYKLPLLDIQTQCDGCTAKFSVSHSLSYKVGSLIKIRYNESRDTIECMAYTSFQPLNICNEPIIYPCHVINELKDTTSGISMEIQDRGDLLVRIFWNHHIDCIIDVRVCDVN